MGETKRYGATPEEWARFDMSLGLTEDLLPVVSNPDAVISPKSNMKDKGKVPSLYKGGYVVGVTKWTQRHASDFDIETWSAQPDYGICIQTRNIRALDIDVTDEGMASEIALFICKHLGEVLPVRYRENSSKCLFAFRLEGELPKRVIRVTEKTEHATAQIIEFLANGQQFVAAGTHSSGARIEWNWNGHSDFPTLTAQQFEGLWLALADRFACAESMTGSLRKRGDYVPTEDEIANKIIDMNLDLGQGNDGQLFIDCPWKDNHSMDSGITETAYFPRGTGGYELGHFKCLHAGCAHHKDEDFEQAMGLNDGMFAPVPPVINPLTGEVDLPAPRFVRTKAGLIEASLYNLRLALARPDICGREVRFDTFRDQDMVRPLGGTEWLPMSNGDSVNLREHLEQQKMFKPIGRELMRDALVAHAERCQFDTAIEWLENEVPEWDGVKRIDSFMHIYMMTEDTDYARAVGRYMWTALAGRCLVPGIKADMAVILQGEQGVLKSTTIAAMAPSDATFAELSIGDKEDTLARRMRGKLVIELGELRGLYTKEFEAVKAFIARRFDEWVPKFLERTTTFHRRSIFIGTTNHAEFLVDETGNRRFLPIIVGLADIKAIKRDRDQLWAEARDTFMAHGIQWAEAERLAKYEHYKFVVHDSWEDDITTWMNTTGLDKVKPIDKEFLRTNDILREAVNIDSARTSPALEKRVAKVLKQMGWVSTRKYIDGKQQRVFVKL